MARFQLHNPLLQRVQRYAETAVLFRSTPFPATGTSSVAPATAVSAPPPQTGDPIISLETRPPLPQPASESSSQPSRQDDQSWRRLVQIMETHQQKALGETPTPAEISRSVAEGAPEPKTPVQPQTQPLPVRDTNQQTIPKSDAPLPPLPLDKAWGPVQKTTVEEKTAVRPAAEPPVAPEQKAALEKSIQAKLVDTQTAQPTQSEVEIHVPRRRRPDAPSLPASTPPAPPQPALRQWVETDIGPLPSDLWPLIGEVPPAQGMVAPAADIVHPPTVARQAVAEAGKGEIMRKTAVSPPPQPNSPPVPPTVAREGEQERPFFDPMQVVDDFPLIGAPPAPHAVRPTEPRVVEPTQALPADVPTQPVLSDIDSLAPDVSRQVAPVPPAPEQPKRIVPPPAPSAPAVAAVPVAKAAPAHRPEMLTASPTIVQRFAASPPQTQVATPVRGSGNDPAATMVAPPIAKPVIPMPERVPTKEERLLGETAVFSPPFPVMREVIEEETAVQTQPEPIQREAAVVEQVAEERPLLQKMPLETVMQPFTGVIQSPFAELMSPEEPAAASEETAAADEPQEDEAGVIEELAQHVYRQLRQQLATDWERRRTR
ncbi:MAG: hypothetical protein KDE56_00700 [Anaerolineales bacterium]|nr:hypothetical protein [Anaerolineales bacterium]